MTELTARTLKKWPHVERMYGEGLTMEAIAAGLRMSRRTVTRLLIAHGREIRPGGRPKLGTEEIRIPALADDHMRWLFTEADRLKISREALMRAMLVDAIEEARNGRG